MKYTVIRANKEVPMKNLITYIDRCLIDEYAIKCFKKGYSLDIDALPKHEISNFLNRLMEHDTSVRDYVLYQMQELINERLPIVEAEHRYDAGYGATIDQQTGETIFLPRREMRC